MRVLFNWNIKKSKKNLKNFKVAFELLNENKEQ